MGSQVRGNSNSPQQSPDLFTLLLQEMNSTHAEPEWKKTGIFAFIGDQQKERPDPTQTDLGVQMYVGQ